MIRTIQTDVITENIKEMCIEANHFLSGDMDLAMKAILDKIRAQSRIVELSEKSVKKEG